MILARESGEYIVPTNKRVKSSAAPIGLVLSHVSDESDGGDEDGDVSVGNNSGLSVGKALGQGALPKSGPHSIYRLIHPFILIMPSDLLGLYPTLK